MSQESAGMQHFQAKKSGETSFCEISQDSSHSRFLVWSLASASSRNLLGMQIIRFYTNQLNENPRSEVLEGFKKWSGWPALKLRLHLIGLQSASEYVGSSPGSASNPSFLLMITLEVAGDSTGSWVPKTPKLSFHLLISICPIHSCCRFLNGL